MYEAGKFKSRLNGAPTKEYKIWRGMLERCYSKLFHIHHPYYVGCSVSENFKNFQYFAEWCNSQVGFGLEDYHLDKDIICEGNKEYHEDRCVFVPSKINYFYIRRNRGSGKYLVGVKKVNNKFKAYISIDYAQVHLGYFATEIEAFNSYKIAKEKLARSLATSFTGRVDNRVILSLQNFTLEISN